jgi:hypothetical protein
MDKPSNYQDPQGAASNEYLRNSVGGISAADWGCTQNDIPITSDVVDGTSSLLANLPDSGTFGYSYADLMLTGGALMSKGLWTVTARYMIQFVPTAVQDSSAPAFFLQTYPDVPVTVADMNAARQTFSGPSWNVMTPRLFDPDNPTTGWASYRFSFQVGTLPLTRRDTGTNPPTDILVPSNWLGALYTQYATGSSVQTPSSADLATWPVLVTRVTAMRARDLSIADVVSSVTFS